MGLLSPRLMVKVRSSVVIPLVMVSFSSPRYHTGQPVDKVGFFSHDGDIFVVHIADGHDLGRHGMRVFVSQSDEVLRRVALPGPTSGEGSSERQLEVTDAPIIFVSDEKRGMFLLVVLTRKTICIKIEAKSLALLLL
jgi:hypothetical protein